MKKNILAGLRVSRGKTQAEMAELLGISEQTYNQKELGKRDFMLSESKRLSDYFGKSIEEIFFTHKVNTNETGEKNTA